MKRVVLDPGGLLAWFGDEGRALRAHYEAGGLEVHVPRGFALDVLERAAAEQLTTPDHLAQLADELERLGFAQHEVSAVDAAEHLEPGRGARQAAYVALAERLDLPLVTADSALLRSLPRARRPADA